MRGIFYHWLGATAYIGGCTGLAYYHRQDAVLAALHVVIALGVLIKSLGDLDDLFPPETPADCNPTPTEPSGFVAGTDEDAD